MPGEHGWIETLTRPFAPVHRDGHKFILAGGVATLGGWLIWPLVGWLALGVTIWFAVFFRDPDRVTPLREGLVIAAADGIVETIEKVDPLPELAMEGGERWRVSTHLSLFDVHVNRSPIAGRVKRSVYVPGAFLVATSDKSSDENERRALLIEGSDGIQVAVVQIAGFITRRILTFAHEGDSVGVGQRFGLIRFGSRVDVYLPPGILPMVAVGQRMVAGETVLADRKSQEAEREARRS